MNTLSSLIEKLAELSGFHKSYINSFGIEHKPNIDALSSILSAMGFNVDNEQVIQEQIQTLANKHWREITPPCQVLQSSNQHPHILLNLPHKLLPSAPIKLTITTEDNQVINQKIEVASLETLNTITLLDDSFSQFKLPIPLLKQGYHTLMSEISGVVSHCFLIIAPDKCFSAEQASIDKVWGYSAQLYSLKSEENFGMGDFNDLHQLIKAASKQGASTIGINPLHPLFQINPEHISPYSPTSRSFLNILYIHVQTIHNFSSCEEAKRLFNSEHFQQELSLSRSKTLIDYPKVAELKFDVLALLFEDFMFNDTEINLEQKRTFLHFIEENKAVHLLATFEALYEHFNKNDKTVHHWQQWPTEYQSVDTNAVKTFQQEHKTRITYFMYLQWLAHQQLSSAASLTVRVNMPIGLYLDLAVGSDGAGFDVWANQQVYVAGVSIGAPPDAMNTLGQNWGLTPMNPLKIKETGYSSLITSIRSNMQYAGALRIDHILGLMRQYWVAPEMAADEGIYISFPLHDILSIIALESQRNKCIVIGEDLGTVPEGFTDIIAKYGLLSYKVLYFERWWETGLFKRPTLYQSQSIATVSTHDVPTLKGWWTERDLYWKQKLNLYPNTALKQQEQRDRINDKKHLIAALIDAELLPNKYSNIEISEIDFNDIRIAAQQYIAVSGSHIQLIALEDALALTEQVNIPGTIDEHPNWRQKLPISLSEVFESPLLQEMSQVMDKLRPRKN